MTTFNAPWFCIDFDGGETPVVWGDCNPPATAAAKRAPKSRKPADWRRSLSYRTPKPRAVKRDVRAREAAYVAWLAAARGWSTAEAWAYCNAMDKRTLISATHGTVAPIAADYRMAA